MKPSNRDRRLKFEVRRRSKLQGFLLLLATSSAISPVVFSYEHNDNHNTLTELDFNDSSTTSGSTVDPIVPLTSPSIASNFNAAQEDSDIRVAIEKFESSHTPLDGENSTISSQPNQEATILTTDKPVVRSHNNGNGKRKLIRSRYRLRSTSGSNSPAALARNDASQQANSLTNAGSGSGAEQQLTSNYSQPFDGLTVVQPLKPSLTGGPEYRLFHNHQQQQQILGRALVSSGVAPITSSNGHQSQQASNSDPTAPYATAYLSTSSQRSPFTLSAGGESSTGQSDAGVQLAADEQPMQPMARSAPTGVYGNNIVIDSTGDASGERDNHPKYGAAVYLPPLHQGYQKQQQQHHHQQIAATGRMLPQPMARMRSSSLPPSVSASEMNLPYYLASPSSSSSGGGGHNGASRVDSDYFGPTSGGGNGMQQPTDYPGQHEHDNYFTGTGSPLMRNFSDHLGYASAPFVSSSTSPLFNNYPYSMDSDSFGGTGGGGGSSGHYGHSSPSFHSFLGGGGDVNGGMTSVAVPRSRWSWPWTDVSSYGSGSGHMPSATFKKHYHHHYMPAHHKGHDGGSGGSGGGDHHHHHEEHDHMMSKWEHGITIGEIACIAVAVVLGIIILGSPFFLLFLMLFNGGNLFGATQMGLLAPAATPAGTATVAGRRRRKRSIREAEAAIRKIARVAKGGVSGGLTKEQLEEIEKLRAQLTSGDLVGMGNYLFEKLSPFVSADKLMQSFVRIMEVKDDVEKLVGKLNLEDNSGKASGSSSKNNIHAQTTSSPSSSSTSSSIKWAQHIEMKRRKRR